MDGVIIIENRKLRDFLSIALIIVLAVISIAFAYLYLGPQSQGFRMTLAGCGIILYIVIKDIIDKQKKRKEEEMERNGGKTVMSLNKDEKSRVDIGKIAHRSTRKLDIRQNSGSGSQSDATNKQ